MNLLVPKSKQIVVKEKQKSTDNARSYIKVANAISAAKVPEGVKVTSTERGLSIRIADDALFSSGSSTINPKIEEFLDLMTGLVRDLPNSIAVEGHTDNQPINTAQFKSNSTVEGQTANRRVELIVLRETSPRAVDSNLFLP